MSDRRERDPGARREPPLRPVPSPAPPLDVGAALSGRRILLTGATGFLGKVALSLLLDRYPQIGRVFVLVRVGAGGSPEARFADKVVSSRPLDPVRARHGAGLEAFLAEKCVPVAGDVTDPLFGLSERDLARMEGLDLVVNCAGLVDFAPSLDLAIQVNARGAAHAVGLCRRLGAALLHVSTSFVAGNRDGVVFEDEPIRGYFPRREDVVPHPKGGALDPAAFDPEEEIADCERRISQVRESADDRTLLSRFGERARERLRQEGRDPGDARALRLAVGREKKLWIAERLVELGMERARHWGWPNTYTYTKSLGEQVVAASDVRFAIVRPSIVESALRYPFPGWNEGFTTSAPLVFLSLKGHRAYPGGKKTVLDVVPVDLVAAGLVAVGADLLDRTRLRRTAPPSAAEPSAGRVYHLASGDVNPFYVHRCFELVGLYQRRLYARREEGNPLLNLARSRLEPYRVDREHFDQFSTPAAERLARAAQRLLRERTPRWGMPRLQALAERLSEGLDEWQSQLERSRQLFELFMPFLWDNEYVFRCAAIRELYERLSPEDRARLPWDPERLDWRSYWIDVHVKGLEQWVFPGLEEESQKKVHVVRPHRDLIELLFAAAERHGHRVALRMSGERKETLTYRELARQADRVGAFLRAAGVAKGDRVLLASENRPEWASAYFGILRAGAVAVPVDALLSPGELAHLARSAGARVLLVSERVRDRAEGLELALRAAGIEARLALLHEALAGGPPTELLRGAAPDDVASLIFTSGTTGTPKGVLLTHRNFASLVAKLGGVFRVGPGDGLLSVLPLHHTFEFACGLLVPLAGGAEIEYLDEVSADRIGDALEEGRVTAMIGVPALWSLLHRRITQEISAAPRVVEEGAALLRRLNASLRDRQGLNLGKLLFWPVHRKLGGRLRILVSGGSALSPEVQRAFHEMGFDLYEGYGLTESAPVLSVSTPKDASRIGHVGRALPGIEIRIHEPDASGVGEVLARGPNVMLGYFQGGPGQPEVDRDQTAAVLRDGWLHTGDLGRLDAEGRLSIVGRRKDVIIDADGKNVYPDEVEALYAEPALIQELAAVGLPEAEGERVALLVVPAADGRDPAEARRLADEHLRRVSATLPFYKRAKVWHFSDGPLPRTATRKVKRALVVEELRRLEASAHRGRRSREAALSGADDWVLRLLAEVARRPGDAVGPSSHLLADLGFDSLMMTELQAALEDLGVSAETLEQVPSAQTAGDLVRLLSGSRQREDAPPRRAPDRARGLPETAALPETVRSAGRAAFGLAQRALYGAVFHAKVSGQANVPVDRNVLVVANHASHLDMGLVKYALGEQGSRLAAMAAADYFFDTPLKRAYFENFTNLIPMERTGSVRKSLRSAISALRRGYNVLIFPEGTRSRDGALQPFKPTAGYLALHCGVDTLPVYLSGTHEALPKGALLPRTADLKVAIGPVIRVDDLRARTADLPKGEAHKVATLVMEEAVHALRDAVASSPPAEVRAPGEAPPEPEGAPREPRAGERPASPRTAEEQK
ncbi:MAG TPA: AMP-binding protein [Anaeromyxobacteraceae bacterium]|nr:AMP-binding protein [Anaeromyxobacteraceae bacterium]